jgi:hypothetical protein
VYRCLIQSFSIWLSSSCIWRGFLLAARLKDVEYTSGRKLYLVFEYLNQDLKKYMDSCGSARMAPLLIKSYLYQVPPHPYSCCSCCCSY